ncbi:MAG: C25 family cysteine peptidase, partial [Bacteroidota bacterium]
MKKISLVIAMMLSLFSLSVIAQSFTYADSWGKAGFNLVDSKSTSVQVIFSVPQFSLDDFSLNGQTVKDVDLPGAMLFNDAGAPNLPGRGSYIAVPQGATPRLTILSQRTEIIHNVDIVPAPVIPWDNDKSPMVYEKKQSIYSNNALYPENPVKLSDVTQIRGVDAVLLGITPFQYNPVTKDLVVYKDIKVEITFEGGNGKYGDDRLRSRWFDPILQDALLNRDVLPEIDYGKRASSLAGEREVGFEYLIIVPNNPEFTQWADSIKEWRTLQGIRTGIKTLQEVGGNTSTAIKNYVTNAYNTWTIPPVAVLLLADYGSNAANSITSPLWDNYCVSDNIYADVNNNMMPDIIFSRITANNAAQLQIMVSKGIKYERNPPTSADFYHHPITALGWQTERWFQLCSEIVGGFWHNTMGKDQVRINAVYEGNPASDPWSTATNTGQVINYFGPNGLGYIPATPQGIGGFSGGTPGQVVNAINSGAFILQHRDHGYEDGWGEPGFNGSHISQLTNTDLTFVFSINCLTGKYNYSGDCFGEKFHRYTKNGNNSGALGFVAPSEVSYSFVNDAYTWGMYDNMWPNFMPSYGTTPPSRGMLPAVGMTAGKYFLQQSNWPYNTDNKEVTYYLFHAHCDAFLNLYSEVPQNLTVQHEGVLLSGMTAYDVTANAGSFIALTANGEILGTAVGTGSPVSVTIPAQLPGTFVNITVTKENFYRYSQTIQVIPPTGAYVIKDNYWVNDTLLGNGNGLLDYNETVNLSLGMKNVGSETASNIVVTLSTAYPLIAIIDGTENFGNIAPNSAVTILNAFSFMTAHNIPDNTSVILDISATDGTNTWTSTVTLTVHAPVVTIGNMVINDPSGNNNGRLDPGETAEVIITTTNTGSSTSPEAIAYLESVSSYITISPNPINLGPLSPGLPVTATYNVTVDPETPIGSVVGLTHTVNAVAYTGEKTFNVKIGLIVEDFESGNFTQFPWTQGGNQPWTISNVEPYEGVYSA